MHELLFLFRKPLKYLKGPWVSLPSKKQRVSTRQILVSLYINGYHIKQKCDHCYETKLDIGDLLTGFLRIHVAENNLNIEADWSF